MTTNFPWLQYAEVIAGIVMSVILPILRKQLPTLIAALAFPPTKVYIYTGLFSIIAALLVIAFAGETASGWKWYTAVLAGYAWDSTLQKVVRG